VVVRHGPIMGQLFAGRDVPHCDEHNLAFYTDIRIARMIAADHAALALIFRHRPDKKILGNLNLARTQSRAGSGKSLSIENMSSLHTDDLAFRNRLRRKKSPAMNGTVFNEGF